MKHCVVAIVGRPNVGKSALFNRITGKWKAIVDEYAGLTRDRNYAIAQWLDREFLLVDTGGFEISQSDKIDFQVKAQTELAMEAADIILLVVDGRTTITVDDRFLANKLRQIDKPVFLVVNKMDNTKADLQLADYWSLGLGDPYAISALHGRSIDDLLDALLPHLPKQEYLEDEVDLGIKLAIVGRPNVGKSSLVNCILGEERVVVSEVPGTTRDAVSSYFNYQDKEYQIVDTAGLRAKGKISQDIEKYAVMRSLRSIEESNIVVLLLDASRPLTEQDEKIAGFIQEAGRACILAVNKWDLLNKDSQTIEKYVKIIKDRLAFMDYAPIITLSAKTGQRVNRLLDLVGYVNEQHVMRLKTSLLNNALRDMLKKHPPPTSRGRALKIKYIAQIGVRPPSFALFLNEARRMHFNYLRYIKNQLRAHFGLEGTPIIIMLRGAKERKNV